MVLHRSIPDFRLASRRRGMGFLRSLGVFLLGLFLVASGSIAADANKPNTEHVQPARLSHWPLRALDIDGNIHRLGESPTTQAWAFVFLSPRCERSAVFLPVLDRLLGAYEDHHIEFFIVVSDPDVDRAEARAWRDRDQLRIPILFDGGQVLATELGATHTPQAVVMDSAGHRVYCGKIDDRPDRPGDKRARPRQTYLATALRSLTAGRPPLIRKTDPAGRVIDRRAQSERRDSITWARQIAPLVHAHCVECHHAGGLAPFPLTTLAEVRPHAHAIVPLLKNRAMPPWKPVHGFGSFQNERRLSQTEMDLFSNWVVGGTPPGNDDDLPPPQDYGDGWLLGEPDLVYQVRSLESATEENAVIRHYVWPTQLPTERQVSAVEFRPGYSTGVSEISVRIDTSGVARRYELRDPSTGYNPLEFPPLTTATGLGGWAPVVVASRLPPGLGRVLPPSADLVVQVTYETPADLARGGPKLGIFLAPENTKQPVGDLILGDLKLRVPAGASRHRQRARYELPTATTILGLTPHFRDFARDIAVVAVLPDGSTDRLLRIDDWDSKWHDQYLLRRPLRLPAGTRLEMEAVYDNSSKNPRQPVDPPVPVRWGEGPGQETGVCFLQVSADSPKNFAELMGHNADYIAAQLPASPARESGRDATVKQAAGIAPVPSDPEKKPANGFEKALRLIQGRSK
ncbi:MAG: hypothetical protein NT069_34605 [Planctomycetota bacterium]|nr:hypothetical protein [Planctomycetota bacterium]